MARIGKRLKTAYAQFDPYTQHSLDQALDLAIKLATARFYFARLLPETAMLIRQARSGSASLMALDADLF